MLGIRRPLIAALATVLTALCATAGAATPPPVNFSPGAVPTYDDPPAAADWEGQADMQPVTFTSKASGAHLYGVLFSPTGAVADGKALPAVVILPGSIIGVQSGYHWAGRYLASHGYVTLTVDPQGVGKSETFGDCNGSSGGSTPSPCENVPYQQASNWVDAARSALDFLGSAANPLRAITDVTRMGASGHSLGARAVSYLQGVDQRLDAIVAWDNLASDLSGDDGSAAGNATLAQAIGGEIPGPSTPVTPRVPAMGQASETGVPAKTPDSKKTAYDLWRASRLPTMELVFAGTVHGAWSRTGTGARNADIEQYFAYYTLAWYDLFLKNDRSAIGRLEASAVFGKTARELVSTSYRSGLFLPTELFPLDPFDCPDFPCS